MLMYKLQSTEDSSTVFPLSSDIYTETENFLRQRDYVTQMRTIYFALYKCKKILLLFFLPNGEKPRENLSADGRDSLVHLFKF